MPEYLFTGFTADGRQETSRVEAPSADMALKLAKQRGYRDIVLHTDDVQAHYTNLAEVENQISPAEYVGFRYFRGFLDDALFVVGKMYTAGWFLFLPAAFVVVVRRAMGWPWSGLDYVCLGLLGFPIVLSFASQLFNPVHRYHRLIDALAWGRWEEVLSRLPGLEGKIPAEEYAFTEAQALAGLGRLDEAMKVLKPFADGERMPAWMYWGRLGDVYFAAGKPELIVPAQEKAAEMAPDNPTVLLDVAMALVRYRRDAERAGKLLQEARTHALSDVLEIFAQAIEGMIAVESGQAAHARDCLENALEELKPLRHATPLIGAAIDRTYAYLALAYAELGEREKSAACYRRAESRLRALRSTDLIQRCETALGLEPAKTAS